MRESRGSFIVPLLPANMISLGKVFILFAVCAAYADAQGYNYPAPQAPEGGEPEPFNFDYKVNEADTNFAHKADSDGNKVTGEYMVQLPDGRTQKVKYTADQGGFNADVQYEGEASFPAGGGSGGRGGGSGGRGGGSGGRGSGGGGYPSGRPGGSYLPPRRR